ncbi:GNAT family N-acetyltransferase [Candidatus Roizmanbacteria bacterium]|nr:GNAT family N-acetyltransferase [Candidatus Roizmanbacteria bacterium]
MKITFREYNEKDRDLLLKLTNKLEVYAKFLDPIRRVKNLPGFTEISLKETLENVEKYQGKIWLAEDEGKVIGFVIGAIWEESEKNKLEIGPHKLSEVLDIYLEDEYRRKGIGKTMLQMMEKYFKEKGCDSIWILVFAPNENAHNMYKKLGFVDREIGMLKEI